MKSVKPVHVLIQSTVAQLHYTDICLSSCLLERSVEITGSIEGRREGGDEWWKTQREKEKDKESDIRGLRVWSLPVGLGWRPKAESRIGSVPDHTEDPHAQKTCTYCMNLYRKLTGERRSCENINLIVQGPLVEAGFICLRILSPFLPSTENINTVT